MKTIVNYPFGFTNSVPSSEAIDQFFNQFVNANFPDGSPLGRQSGENLALDIWEKDNTIFIRAEVPGIDPSKMDVSVNQSVLTLAGTYEEVQEDSDVKWHRKEVRRGEFSRSVRLPKDVNLEAVSAKFQNGMVMITIPKLEPVQPPVTKIPIEVESATTAQETSEQS